MCGIVGGVTDRDIAPILIEGLRRLEYRGYDSAGLAIISPANVLQRLRALGKVSELAQIERKENFHGSTGIAHTRWATHGIPSEANAHPHTSSDEIAVVHNGIIENHQTLRDRLIEHGYGFYSQTDSEVFLNLLTFNLDKTETLKEAIVTTFNRLEGNSAFVIMSKDSHVLYSIKRSAPLVCGLNSKSEEIEWANDQD